MNNDLNLIYFFTEVRNSVQEQFLFSSENLFKWKIKKAILFDFLLSFYIYKDVSQLLGSFMNRMMTEIKWQQRTQELVTK